MSRKEMHNFKNSTEFIAYLDDLYELLVDAKEHLDYCNYGDSWERECAIESKLKERIEKILGD